MLTSLRCLRVYVIKQYVKDFADLLRLSTHRGRASLRGRNTIRVIFFQTTRRVWNPIGMLNARLELSVLATRIKDTDNNAGPVIEHRIGAARISVTPMAEPVQIRIRVRVPVVVHPVQGTTIVEHDLAMTVTTDQKTTKVSIRAAIKTIALLRRVSAIMSTLGPCSIP